MASAKHILIATTAFLSLTAPPAHAQPDTTRQNHTQTLTETLTELQQTYTTLENQLRDLEKQIKETQLHLQQLEKEKKRHQTHLSWLNPRHTDTTNKIAHLEKIQQKRVVTAYINSGQTATQQATPIVDPTESLMWRALVDEVFSQNTKKLENLKDTQHRLQKRINETQQKQTQTKNETKKQLETLTTQNQAATETRETRKQLALRIHTTLKTLQELDRAQTILQQYTDGSRRNDGSEPLINLNTDELLWPTEGILTSPYGMRWGALHAGIDIGAPTGTPILAVADGTILFTGFQGGYGLMTIIDHGDGIHTAYAHQSRFRTPPQTKVKKGDIIGEVGSTGDSTGPHLHFELRADNITIDPLPYLINRR